MEVDDGFVEVSRIEFAKYVSQHMLVLCASSGTGDTQVNLLKSGNNLFTAKEVIAGGTRKYWVLKGTQPNVL